MLAAGLSGVDAGTRGFWAAAELVVVAAAAKIGKNSHKTTKRANGVAAAAKIGKNDHKPTKRANPFGLTLSVACLSCVCSVTGVADVRSEVVVPVGVTFTECFFAPPVQRVLECRLGERNIRFALLVVPDVDDFARFYAVRHSQFDVRTARPLGLHDVNTFVPLGTLDVCVSVHISSLPAVLPDSYG